MLNHTIIVAAAAVPSLVLLWYFHSRDRFPEPAGTVWKTFFWGVLAVVPVVLLGLPLRWLVPHPGNPIAAGMKLAFVHAAVPEETIKLLVVVFYCMKRSEFDEPMDGFVYGTAASLGFATLENFLYVADGGLRVAWTRAFTAVPAHAMFGAVMGYFAAHALFHPERRLYFLFLAWIFPVMLHGLYDFPLMIAPPLLEGGAGMFQAFLLNLAPVTVLVLGWWWVLTLSRRIRAAQDAAAPAAEG